MLLYLIFSDILFNEICILMVHVSTKDPLWEVKIFAYDFWDTIIQKLVTKSCIQNDTEGLNNSLVKLSATGCLQVS